MPLSKKGNKIMESMNKSYGPVKAKKVFYSMKNKGSISGVDKHFYGHMDPMAYYDNKVLTSVTLSDMGDAKSR